MDGPDHMPIPTGVGPFRGARGKRAPNANGLGCPKCKNASRGCAQCKGWLETDPSRAWGNAPTPTPTPNPTDGAPTTPAAPAGSPLPDAPAGNGAPAADGDELAPRPRARPAAGAPADESSDSSDSSDSPDSSDSSDSEADDEPTLLNVGQDDRSALMVMCDPGYVQTVSFSDLNPDERARANQQLEREIEVRERRNRTVADDVKRGLATKIATNIRNTKFTKLLPPYKCVARPLTEREAVELYERRVEIDKAWRGQSDDARQKRAAEWLDEITKDANGQSIIARNGGVQALAKNGSALRREYESLEPDVPMDVLQGELNARLARMSLDTLPTATDQERMRQEFDALARSLPNIDTDTVMSDYMDFMNEERLRLLQTIGRANTRATARSVDNASNPEAATPQELDEQLELDAMEEATRLFDGLAMPTTDAEAQAETFQPVDLGELIECRDVPRVEFYPVLPKKAWNETAWYEGGGRMTDAQARDWCLSHGEAWFEVPQLSAHNDCLPIERWAFPYRGPMGQDSERAQGMWLAFKRTRELRNEFGLAKKTGANSNWACVETFKSEPLFKVSQRRVHPMTRDFTLFDQVCDEHVTLDQRKKLSDNKFRVTTMQIEMLRNFPKRKPGVELNSLVDFVCWWHVNLKTNDAALEHIPKRNLSKRKTEIASSEKTNEKYKLVYDLMCAPDLQKGGIPYSKMTSDDAIPDFFRSMRGNVHGRVMIVGHICEILYECLMKDVFQTDQRESVLWMGGNMHLKAKQAHGKASAAARTAQGKLVQAEQQYEAAYQAFQDEPVPEGVPASDVAFPPEVRALRQRADALGQELALLKTKAEALEMEAEGMGAPTEAHVAAGQQLYRQWTAMHPRRN